MSEPEVADLQARGYNPAAVYESNPLLKRAIDLLASGHFTEGNRDAMNPLVMDLLYNDRFLALADFQSYIEAQAKVDELYADPDAWSRKAILNVARTGFFSSDRSMREYLDRIWHDDSPPVRIGGFGGGLVLRRGSAQAGTTSTAVPVRPAIAWTRRLAPWTGTWVRAKRRPTMCRARIVSAASGEPEQWRRWREPGDNDSPPPTHLRQRLGGGRVHLASR